MEEGTLKTTGNTSETAKMEQTQKHSQDMAAEAGAEGKKTGTAQNRQTPRQSAHTEQPHKTANGSQDAPVRKRKNIVVLNNPQNSRMPHSQQRGSQRGPQNGNAYRGTASGGTDRGSKSSTASRPAAPRGTGSNRGGSKPAVEQHKLIKPLTKPSQPTMPDERLEEQRRRREAEERRVREAAEREAAAREAAEREAAAREAAEREAASRKAAEQEAAATKQTEDAPARTTEPDFAQPQRQTAEDTRRSPERGGDRRGSGQETNRSSGRQPARTDRNVRSDGRQQQTRGDVRPARSGDRSQNRNDTNRTDGRTYAGRSEQRGTGTGRTAYQGTGRSYNGGGRSEQGYSRPSNGSKYNGGDNRGASERSSGQGGRTDSRSRRPAAKGYGTDLSTKEGEKRRDEEKRRSGQERDRRSRKDYIYEEEGVAKGRSRSRQSRVGKSEPVKQEPVEEQIKVIVLPDSITLKELADKMKVQASAIIKKLFLEGKAVTVNQELSFEDAEAIAIDYDIICEKEVKVDVIEELLREDEEKEENLKPRPPVICVMGHVDHGKTSLLDAIRNTNVTEREAGGITQHIGAYTVMMNGQRITFLDTPGHEAFTAMRMRGANATDIAVLVVAADDGVMPQTIEAINHAKAAGIEIIVAINKIDKPNANVERVKQELTEYGLIPEEWGGSTVFAPISAKTGEGISELLEMILLSAELLELKANPDRQARGLVIEAQLDKGRGPVATVLVQKGTLHVGDFISAGACHGKVRAMIDDKGKRVKVAGPSMPVEILGLSDVPDAGEVFLSHVNDKEARTYAEAFIAKSKEKKLEETKSKMSLDDLFNQIKEGNLKELNLIVKADVQGSVEAVRTSLLKLTNEEVVVKCIHAGVGAINESDVTLAATSNAIIIGFNVRPDPMAKSTAEREGVDIRLYNVIYQAIEDVEAAMKGMLDPIFEEKVIGHAEIRQIFHASAVGNIAGSYVLDGELRRDCRTRITREEKQIYEGSLSSLKRFKDDVKEVRAGFECGLVFAGFDQIAEGDLVEAYIMVEVPR